MPSISELLTRQARALMLPLVVLAAGLTTPAQATPPKAPTNLALKTTLALAPPASGTSRYYRLTWDDNSLDESGFRIELRFGNSGPFLFVDTVSANVTEYILSYDFGNSGVAQFRVVAFKHNGNKVESSASVPIENVATTSTANLNAPSNFRVAEVPNGEGVNDGVLKFSWKDRSTSEIYYQIFYKKQVEAEEAYLPMLYDPDFPNNPANYVLHLYDNKEGTAATDRTEVLVRHNLVPGESYHFMLRATRRLPYGTLASHPASNLDSAKTYVETYPNAAQTYYTAPKQAAPSNLTGEPLDAERVILRWKDNSFNETGFELSYRAPGATTWASTDKFTLNQANLTSYTITVGAGGSLEWRIRAIHDKSDLPVEATDYSDPYTVFMDFIKPDGLTATTSGASGTINLEWNDSSEGESSYDIYTRVVDEETVNDTWYFVQTVLADTTRLTVSSRTAFDNPYDYQFDAVQAVPTPRVPLTIDAEHEFIVVGRSASGESDPSNTASAFSRHGFTSRAYHPAKVGEAFNYTMTVSNPSNRASWAVNGLPEGLEFNETTGQITGEPEEFGVFESPMTVTYTGGHSATLPLTLRILREQTLPQVAATFSPMTLGSGTQFYLELEDKFADAEFEKAVRLDTTMGVIDLMLFPSLVPESVENFMGYVENGLYDGVIFHRSVPGFIVQGGGFYPVQEPNAFATVEKRPAGLNEPGISNLRGTVAHAKVGDNPDSATHDFFFNLEDNSLKTGIELDNQNSGFTVFARVAGDGMEKVDDIAELPIGRYGTTVAGSIIVDGSLLQSAGASALTDVPMNVTTEAAPVPMNLNATVQIRSAREVGAFKYEVENSDPTVARAVVVTDGRLRVDGISPGTSTVKVKARDLDNNLVEQSFAVTVVKGHKLPVITRQPVSVAVQPGKKATLKVTATGTDILYQWRKGGVNITGATKNTHIIAAVQEGDVGEYDVQVSNATTVLTSDTVRVDFRSAPVVDSSVQLASKVVEAGTPLVLTGKVNGAPAPVITWLRSGKKVAKQTEQTLNIPAAAVTDGGTYVMRAKNVEGTVETNAATIIVVDKATNLRITAANKTVVLKAQASGPDLTYQWKKGETEVTDDGERISGAGTATLTIKKFGTNIADAGDYTCVVRNAAADLEAETGPWKVGVAGAPPMLDAFVPANAYVGIEYNYTIPGGGDDNTSIASFAVSGLPGGLTLDKVTGHISGKATRAGEYTLKVTVKNPKGSRSVSNIPMNVLPMPESVVGAFIGQIGASPAFNQNKGGRIDLFVSEGGQITGKLSQGKEVLSFTGQMLQTPGNVFTQGEALVKRKGNIAPLKLVLSSYAVSGNIYSGDISGTLYDEVDSVQFTAYRSQYNAKKGRISPYVGRQNLGLNLVGDAVGDESVPQGHGYVVALLDANGTAKVAGRMADGTTVTSSSFLGAQQQFLIYQSLYKHTGAVVGQASLFYLDQAGPANNPTNRFRVDGQLAWTKTAQTSAKERNYASGFGPLPVSVLGMTYMAPGTNAVVMGLPKQAGNASILFEEGGLEESELDPSVNPLTLGGTPLVPSGSTNEGKLKLSVTAATGLFSGSFELESVTEPKRKATFNGLIIPQIPTIPAATFSDGSTRAEVPGVDAIGLGHFLLGQLPSGAETLKTAPILAGSVEIYPTPIRIVTPPVAQTVNPNTANVTFSVVATAPVAITSYQWRKDGVAISTATNSSYTIPMVTETQQGIYDVVIRTATSSIISPGALLDVNDPVGNVVVTRTPANNPVALGEDVTVVYSVTATGAGDFTYRWRKNGSDIDGAAAAMSTYTISPVTVESAGQYSVRVMSTTPVSNATSATNLLTVANPITSVTAQRDPDTETVNYGAAVQFSIADIDSSGPYEFQWYKVSGEEDVPVVYEDGTLATGETYTIAGVSGSDAGVYKVKVKNSVTPEAVVSNEVELQVSSQVANVVVTRSPSTQYIDLGDPVEFRSSAQGEPDFTYKWYKVVEGEDVLIQQATNAIYAIPNVTAESAGDYKVLVINESTPDGVMSAPSTLQVKLPVASATIEVLDDNFNPNIGDTVVLTAVPNAGAVGSFDYQWFKDDGLLEDATGPEYVITGFSETDYGEYTVEVQNSANNDNPVLSAPAALTPPNEDP
ncbi:immunoglobulin domain-containing protein [Prosthecobacter sp. SYSU 5D2]|uniref:immunoglobulin domain-containing protein n=1 Tax=Prosthecobacter sp. SYSU 5D2 TaxID=3134134 RepID=UPI0031FE87A2